MIAVVVLTLNEQFYNDIESAELRINDKNGMSHTIMGVELKPLPPKEKLDVYYCRNPKELKAYNFGLGIGWNACLDEIVREEDESNDY